MIKQYKFKKIPEDQQPSKTQLKLLRPGDQISTSSENGEVLCDVVFRDGDLILGRVFKSFDDKFLPGKLISFLIDEVSKVIVNRQPFNLSKFVKFEDPKTGHHYVFHTKYPRFIGQVELIGLKKRASISAYIKIDMDHNEQSEMFQLTNEAADWWYYSQKEK